MRYDHSFRRKLYLLKNSIFLNFDLSSFLSMVPKKLNEIIIYIGIAIIAKILCNCIYLIVIGFYRLDYIIVITYK